MADYISASNKLQRRPTSTDLEDWVGLKEQLARAEEFCDHDQILEALPLLRDIIRESHHFMKIFPNPGVIFASTSPLDRDRKSMERTVSSDEPVKREISADSLNDALQRDRSRQKRSQAKQEELPTAFHALLGIALFLMGNIIAQDPSLALPGEPNVASTYWLAALDVFATGEGLPSLLDGHTNRGASEDWRMAVYWGRTLVRLAEEALPSSALAEERYHPHSSGKQRHVPGMAAYQSHTGPFSNAEPNWPNDSPFYMIAFNRPPITRRMSLQSASSHDILLLAMDQFSRGIFNMPHAHDTRIHNFTSSDTLSQNSPPYSPLLSRSVTQDFLSPHSPTSPTSPASPTSPTSPTSATSESHSSMHQFANRPQLSPLALEESSLTSHFQLNLAGPLTFSRPKELFTVASEVLGVAERLPSAESRQYWASWADSIFNQMKMEADIGTWRGIVTRARGRCWLIIGSAKAEPLEEALEMGEDLVLESEDAKEAREGLQMAISFFERAKGSATLDTDEDAEDISPLLAEALLTLANLTVDVAKREQLYARAKREGGDAIEIDLENSTPLGPAASPGSTLESDIHAPSTSRALLGTIITGQRRRADSKSREDDAMLVDEG